MDAGVGALSPCNLPLVNQLTDAILNAVIGTDNKEKLISLWNSKIHEIQYSVQNNDWIHLPRKYFSLKSDKVNISNPTDRPRLVFIIGYGGVDFFDIKPFFDSLKNKSFPGKAIYLHYCSEEEYAMVIQEYPCKILSMKAVCSKRNTLNPKSINL